MLQHIPFPALPAPPSWYPGHMTQFTRMLPGLLRRTDVVLELRDARLPLTSINRNFEGKSAALFSSFLLIDRAHCGTTRCHVHGFFEAEWHCNVARRLDAECRCCAVGAFSSRTLGTCTDVCCSPNCNAKPSTGVLPSSSRCGRTGTNER